MRWIAFVSHFAQIICQTQLRLCGARMPEGSNLPVQLSAPRATDASHPPCLFIAPVANTVGNFELPLAPRSSAQFLCKNGEIGGNTWWQNDEKTLSWRGELMWMNASGDWLSGWVSSRQKISQMRVVRCQKWELFRLLWRQLTGTAAWCEWDQTGRGVENLV